MIKKIYTESCDEIPIKSELIKETLIKMQKDQVLLFSYTKYLQYVGVISVIGLLILAILISPNLFGNKNTFTVTAYANESAESEYQSVNITKRESPKIKLKNEFDMEETSNVDEYWNVYTDLRFKCEGENIETITLSTDKGEFINKIALSKDDNIDGTGAKQAMWPIDKDGSVEEGTGYIPLGKSYTVSYSEQNNKQYGFEFKIKKSKQQLDNSKGEDIYNMAQKSKNTISIIATFSDGTKLSKKVELTIDGQNLYFIEK
ncbi:hypothetical protein ACN077_11255 [Clostridium chromiireducens]|uniref:hypothetical protein n=1 Tax=Clostridium chromiireducens TaxID=225345 RepID=UPI003AF5353E